MSHISNVAYNPRQSAAGILSGQVTLNPQIYLQTMTTIGSHFHKKEYILHNLDLLHKTFYEADTFSGPSLYFHHRALDSRNCPNSFAEASYAMLISWGMHRMGPGGSKMKHFDEFKGSLDLIWSKIRVAARLNHAKMTEDNWRLLKEIFFGINVMASGTSLVGNSKVMAHALPNLIAPIDRSYTLQYLYGNKNIRNNKEKEWDRLRGLMTDFFYPVVNDQCFIEKREHWKRSIRLWDTSCLKIVDNLIIGAIIQQKKHLANKETTTFSLIEGHTTA